MTRADMKQRLVFRDKLHCYVGGLFLTRMNMQ